MSSAFAEIEQQAGMLAPDERARLAEFLLESLCNDSLQEIEAAWQSEIEKRVAAFDRGEVKTFLAEDVFAEARRISR
ncbi:MAG: addiction module protein [Syntrophales bacterium]